MAEALLRRRLADEGLSVPVSSAGFVTEGREPPSPVIEVMDGYGLDLRGHRSRLVTAAMLRDAELVAVMERRHLREAVALDSDVFPRIFTLVDLVVRATAAGPPGPAETLADWAARLDHGRRRADQLTPAPSQEIADQMGGPTEGYERTAAELDGLTARLAAPLGGLAARDDRSEVTHANGAT